MCGLIIEVVEHTDCDGMIKMPKLHFYVRDIRTYKAASFAETSTGRFYVGGAYVHAGVTYVLWEMRQRDADAATDIQQTVTALGLDILRQNEPVTARRANQPLKRTENERRCQNGLKAPRH